MTTETSDPTESTPEQRTQSSDAALLATLHQAERDATNTRSAAETAAHSARNAPRWKPRTSSDLRATSRQCSIESDKAAARAERAAADVAQAGGAPALVETVASQVIATGVANHREHQHDEQHTPDAMGDLPAVVDAILSAGQWLLPGTAEQDTPGGGSVDVKRVPEVFEMVTPLTIAAHIRGETNDSST